jgi:hypothetical protein
MPCGNSSYANYSGPFSFCLAFAQQISVSRNSRRRARRRCGAAPGAFRSSRFFAFEDRRFTARRKRRISAAAFVNVITSAAEQHIPAVIPEQFIEPTTLRSTP